MSAAMLLLLSVMAASPAIAQQAEVSPPASEAVPLSEQGAEAFTPTPRSVKVELSQQEVTLGTPFTLSLAVRHDAGQRWELSVPEDLGAFSLLGQQRMRQDQGDEALTTFVLQLSLFELGEQTLEGLTFEVASPEGQGTWQSAAVQQLGLAALPDDVVEEGAELRGFKSAEDVPVFTLRLLWYALLLIALLVLAWLLWRWWRARPKKEAPPPVLDPLDVRTRRALLELRAQKLHEAGEQQAFYVRLSEILRGYVAERYGVEAMESTTHELNVAMSQTSAPKRVVGAIRTMLEEADLVKFAKLQVDASACDAAIDAALQVVDEAEAAARPPPPTTTGAADAS